MSAYTKEYGRHGKPVAQPEQAPVAPEAAQSAGIKIDGFQQVLAMLRIADSEFRESLLRRLAARDRELAASLRAELGI